MSNLLQLSSPICPKWTSKNVMGNNNILLPFSKVNLSRKTSTKAFFFNPSDEPIIKEALKEPVAFMGGIFAGLLRLDLNEEPLKQWINRTVEASGITEQEIDTKESNADDTTPQQIDIE